MANELQGYSKFLRDTLLAHSAVSDLVGNGVFEDLAPQDSAPPYIVFGLHAARVLSVAGADARIFTIPDYYVRAVVESESYAPADAIALAIDAALEGALGQVTVGGVTYQIRGVFQTLPLRYPEVEGGVQYRHAGAVYRTYVHT